MTVDRPRLHDELGKSLKISPVTALLGPRRCGKTTLARAVRTRGPTTFFDLEKPSDLAKLNRAETMLGGLRGLVILDEIQRRPDILPLLRVLADRKPLPCRFLLLGSAAPDLMRHTSESLAGRVRFIEMGGFDLAEAGLERQDRLWARGGFPESFLARSEAESAKWRDDFIRTFLERDIPQLEIRIPAVTLRRFWLMVAHSHGQVWNASKIGGSMGMAHTTVRRHLDVLTGAYMVRQLQPYFLNAKKRLIKSPKIYVRDTGILHQLLNIASFADLEGHPMLGASWEGFALEQVLSRTGDRNAYFWATHGGAELDLIVLERGKRLGFEFKVSDTPALTKSMAIALEDLKLDSLSVVHPGKASYSLGAKVEAVSLRDWVERLS